MNDKTIILVVGARPNFIKMLPVYENLIKLNKYNILIIHTGQHYDFNMSSIFFKQFKLEEKIINLNIESNTQNKQIAEIMTKLEDKFIEFKPKLIIVFGDVNSTLGAALTANKMNIEIAHIESGLRSFDKTMPEEINRIITDQISTYHFITEESGINNLINENLIKEYKHGKTPYHIMNDIVYEKDKISWFFVGNPMIDTLLKFKDYASNLEIYKNFNLQKNEYILVTLHRPSNVNNDINLHIIINTLVALSYDYKIIFPIHPRATIKIKHLIISHEKYINNSIVKENIIIIEPLGYFEFLHFMIYSGIIITDSGGNSEQSSILGIPCLTLRTTTERPITCSHGTNILVKDLDKNKIIKKVKKYIGKKKENINIPYWDGKSGTRIAFFINNIMNDCIELSR